MMKRILLSSTLAVTLSATAAFCQQPSQQPANNDAPATQQDQQHPGHRFHRGQHPFDPQKAAQRMGKRLGLTDDQVAKIEPILATQQQKIAALRSDSSLSKDQRREQFRSIAKDTHTQLSSVLTPEQLEKLQSARHFHGKRQHQSQQDSSAAPTAS
ncbi:MAG TPA: hypothetical protein VGB69_08440 [Edaphobacter sp.]